jgi:predicted nucleic acid-binding protein
MVDDNPDVFSTLAMSATAYAHARTILERYRDQAFSFVDAVVFHMVDEHRSVSRVLTVDGSDFRSFRFARSVEVVTP